MSCLKLLEKGRQIQNLIKVQFYYTKRVSEGINDLPCPFSSTQKIQIKHKISDVTLFVVESLFFGGGGSGVLHKLSVYFGGI